MSKIWELTDNYDSIFYEISDYFGTFEDVGIRDLCCIQNWGLAMRNGEPYLVILDSGITDELYKAYY
jgi:hypothetical protein